MTRDDLLLSMHEWYLCVGLTEEESFLLFEERDVDKLKSFLRPREITKIIKEV